MADDNSTENRPSPLSSITNGSQVRNIEDINAIDRMLWWCCGADPKILERCNYSDRVKFFGLGGIVLATGVLAFVAMFFAVNVIFFTGDYTTQGIIVPFLVALLWGCIIFNLDRFIVSSTGKGDGTEKITSSEIISATPRIIMALVIAFSISAPLEIKLFEKEIKQTFTAKNKEKFNIQKNEIDKRNYADIKILEDELLIKRSEKKIQESIYVKNVANIERETESECLTKCAEYKQLRDAAEIKIKEIKSEIDKLEDERNQINIKRDTELKEFDAILLKEPGLLQQLELLNQTEGAATPVAIIHLLFMIIELGPIFFKMMLTKSTYDHLKHYEDELRLAENGIFEDERLIPGSEHGIAEKFYVYGDAEKIQHENRILHNEQQRVDQEIVRTWQNYVAEQMNKNPKEFIEYLQNHGSFPLKTETTTEGKETSTPVDNTELKSNVVEPIQEEVIPIINEKVEETIEPIGIPESNIIPFEIRDTNGNAISIDVTENLTEFV